MNPSIQKLTGIAGKKKRRIIGLMSGTSLDGLDIALCEISGSGPGTNVDVSHFVTKSYDTTVRDKLKKITSVAQISLAELCYQHTWLAGMHASMIINVLKSWGIEPNEIDCIASHGQTIYHLPAGERKQAGEHLNTTLQITDGDHIAAKTGILTLSDFRQKHTAWGGEGAPMAALADRLLFSHETEDRILLNIGGIGNYTCLPAKQNPDDKLFTTDTGPGNTLMDQAVQSYFGKPFDKDGEIARSGKVRRELLGVLLDDPWFGGNESRSTGPEYFNLKWVSGKAEQAGIEITNIKKEDLVATLTELSAASISDNIKRHVKNSRQYAIYISGGGARNPVLAGRLKNLLGGTGVRNFSELGYDPDAKEAMVFAILANEMLAGEGFDFETGNGEVKKINFGKISFPG